MTCVCGPVFRSGLVVALYFSAPPTAFGLSIDRTPKQAVLFADGTKFIARDGRNSVALYRMSDGAVVHRFLAPTGFGSIALSPGEKQLLVLGSDGDLALWDVQSGERIWEKTPAETGLRDGTGASFSGDGARVAICATSGDVLILDVRTGGSIDTVGFPPGRTNIMSIALDATGSSGFLVELGDRLHRFDVATGRVTDTGFSAAWPVRYSTDGKYIAFRSSNSGSAERLSVVRIGDKLTKQDLGDFSHIAHIRPTRDGSFLVTARTRRDASRIEGVRFTGTRIRPDDGHVQELWQFGWEQGVNERTDYLPEGMVGVSTDAWLVTTITDLRTGRVTHTIDNSVNASREAGWASFVRRRTTLLLGAVGVFALCAGVLVWRIRRVRRTRPA